MPRQQRVYNQAILVQFSMTLIPASSSARPAAHAASAKESWVARYWFAFGLGLFLPITLDGGSHMVSDLYSLGRGFRDRNAWLAALTSHAFPASFYAGDALGSFNSLTRLLTGVLAGFGIAWFAFPYMEASIGEG